jgi:arginyl-tRNA synthetase
MAPSPSFSISLSVKEQLTSALRDVMTTLHPEITTTVYLELPKVKLHGDLATAAAMHIAKQKKIAPRVLAPGILAAFQKTPAYIKWVAGADIISPGFINLHLNDTAKQHVVKEALAKGLSFGSAPSTGRRVIVEYVSANPTGPLHVGHARQAAIGDALCNVLGSQGWSVHREYYYNDAGVQIDTLTKSTQLRALGFKPGDPCWPVDPKNPMSKSFYNGDYVDDIAKAYLAKDCVHSDGVVIFSRGDVNNLDAIQSFAVAYLRAEQSKDLAAFRIAFDSYFLESSLHTSGKVPALIANLTASGHTYEKDGALWLKTTQWGDSEDRVMKKTDGNVTYFVPDVAYHIDKYTRGFDKAINIQGTDHHGTIARVRAGLQAADLGVSERFPDYLLHTMVRVVKDGQEVKISKRAGSYVTLRDLIDWTSTDAVRFMMLSRKADSDYTFDVDLALMQSNENPVFYVQYAYTRIQAVINASTALGDEVSADTDLSSLTSLEAKSLMAQLGHYPDTLAHAAVNLSPHDLTFYLRTLSGLYHSYYGSERILVDDTATRLARVALVKATSQVLANGLAILGVQAVMLANRNV